MSTPTGISGKIFKTMVWKTGKPLLGLWFNLNLNQTQARGARENWRKSTTGARQLSWAAWRCLLLVQRMPNAHHHLEWHVGERRRKPCAPLLRCPPYCVILLQQSQFRSINEIPTILNRSLDPKGTRHHSKREGDHFDRRDGNSCYPTCPPSRWSCCATFVESLFLYPENKQCSRLLQNFCVYVWVKLFLSDPSPIIGYACH